MSFNTGDNVIYKRYSLSAGVNPKLVVEFVNDEQVTCGYLEPVSDGHPGLVRTVILHQSSLEKR